ncbi:MAG: cytochrome P460 family protein [Gammaproteobacteria bacterium]
MFRAILIPCLLLAATAPVYADEVAYPEGYRDWHHVKSMLIEPGHPLEDPFAGLHHVYANPAALAGLRGGEYADGAVLVFDLLEAQTGDKAVVEGPRKLLGIMQRDARASDTGGWRFEAFAGDSRSERLVKDGGASCYACHTDVRDSSFVFSRLRP